jgi:hypothetical protein
MYLAVVLDGWCHLFSRSHIDWKLMYRPKSYLPSSTLPALACGTAYLRAKQYISFGLARIKESKILWLVGRSASNPIIPDKAWQLCACVFTAGQPVSSNYNFTPVIVDRFTEHTRFVGPPLPFNVSTIWRAQTPRLNETVISDRDRIFHRHVMVRTIFGCQTLQMVTRSNSTSA